MSRYYIGVDLGGTKILTGAVNKKGKLVSHYKTPTYSEQGPEQVISRINKAIKKAIKEANLKKKDIDAIGIGAPGQIDTNKGVVIKAQNLKDWVNINLKKEVENAFNIKTFINNDVNMGTIGEFVKGAGKKSKNGIAIFIGTGIGGGIVINNELYKGAGGYAGELGHVIIDINSNKMCSCGNRGCFEVLASRTALSENIVNEIKQGRKSIVTKLCENFTKHVKSKVISKAYEQNDLLTHEMIEKECFYIGVALANYINVFNPDTIVLGGGLMEAMGHELLPKINRYTLEFAFTTSYKNCKIKVAALGDYSAIIGAAIYAKEM